MTRLIDVDALHLVCNVYDSDAKRIIWEINHAPTVDAVPVRHGRWIPKTIVIGGTEFPYGSICSICGEDAINAEGDDFLTSYCPNCGAKMCETQKKPCDDCQQFDCYGCEYAERKEE